MAISIEIPASTRTTIGKTDRRMKDSGRLPAVVYGAAIDPAAIEIDRHDFEQLVAHEAGLGSKVIKLSVDAGAPVNVIVKSLQRHPTKGTLVHVDFWAVKMTQRITAAVPVHLKGEAPGVKAGGVLTHAMREIDVEALPNDLPDFLEADISALEVGDSVHVEQLPLPEGVTVGAPADEIVCAVLAPKVEEVEEVEEIEGVEGEEAEPEVIGEASEEGSEE